MSLTKFALLFVLITFPFRVIGYTEVLAHQKAQQLEVQYRSIIRSATRDCSVVMREGFRSSGGKDAAKNIDVDAKRVVETFLASYEKGFNAFSEQDKIRVNQHVLALVILDYDGYYIYGTQDVRDSLGSTVLKPVLSLKQPYSEIIGDYSYKVTMGENIRFLNMTNWAEVSGVISEITDLPPDLQIEDFPQLQQRIIRNSVVASLEETVNQHNRYMSSIGGIYEFYLPLGEASSWSHSLNEVGVIAFVQGHPLGGGNYLEMVSLSSGRVLEAERVIGYETAGGDLYYCVEGHDHSLTDTEVKIFSSAGEAASEGFWPCHMVGR